MMMNHTFYMDATNLFENMGAEPTAVSPDNTVLIQRLQQGGQVAAYLLAESSLPPDQQGRSIVALATQISDLFNKDELTLLCRELGEELENMPGESKVAKALSLVERRRRLKKLAELVALLKKKRPKAAWLRADQIMLPKVVRKNDLAIVMGTIHRRVGKNVLRDVVAYLDEAGLDCNLLFIVSEGKIPLDTDWNRFPRLFRDAVDDALAQTGGKIGHFFLAGPGSVLFSLGCMWSTLKSSIIYQDDDGYHPVIRLPLE